jgi:deferrochelatase/peroxidase EfeB
MPRSPNQGPRPQQGRGLWGSGVTRRAVISGAALVGVGAGLDRALSGGSATEVRTNTSAATTPAVPFHGEHQAGIVTPPQRYLSFAAFDLARSSRRALRGLLQRWTAAGVAITAGREYAPAQGELSIDPGEAVDLAPSRLTVTFGFGPTLFEQDGRDRFGLAHLRPPMLAPLPPLAGDVLDPASSGGDLCVQACADDPQVTFHAIHLLSMVAGPVARLRWLQLGFRGGVSAADNRQPSRNLLGFKDGTNNIPLDDDAAMNRFVWARQPGWMDGGTYLTARRIQIVFSGWDDRGVREQERAIGRYKRSGAPLGAHREHDPVNLTATDSRGDPVIPIDAHVRVASQRDNNGGERILRRGYAFSIGATAGGLDGGGHQLGAGLFFIAFTRDPTRQLIPLLRRVTTHDALTTFTVHTASAMFAVPGGVERGSFVGEQLFTQ